MILLTLLLKYLLEGIAVAIVAFALPKRKLKFEEICIVALTATAVFSLFDLFSPAIAKGTRQGAGFGIGYNTVGPSLSGLALEGFDGQPASTEPDAIGTCTQSVTACTYSPTSTPSQQGKYVCRVSNGACQPIYACTNTNGTCSLRDEANGLVDTSGKSCILEQVPAKSLCRLAVNTQSGAGQNNVEGFEGYSRKF